jgi:hypothetical protein
MNKNKILLNKIRSILLENVLPTIEHKGKMVHTTNSLGQRIHPTNEGVKQFHDWFEDSKVVDEHGRPKVVYHATSGDFDKFDINRSSSSNRFGHGFYFTNDRKTLESYSKGEGGNIVPAYLKMHSPYTDHSELSDSQVHNFFSAIKTKKFSNGYDATEDHERIKKDVLETPSNRMGRLLGTSIYFDKHEFNHGLNAAGVDGFIKNIFKEPEYVVHHPNQIKSAIGNNGKFSSNDSIVESLIHKYHER